MKTTKFNKVENKFNEVVNALEQSPIEITTGNCIISTIKWNGKESNSDTKGSATVIISKRKSSIEISLKCQASVDVTGDCDPYSDSKHIRRLISIKIPFIKAVLRAIVTIASAISSLQVLIESTLRDLTKMAKTSITIKDPDKKSRSSRKVNKTSRRRGDRHEMKKLADAVERLSRKAQNNGFDWDEFELKQSERDLKKAHETGKVTYWVTGNYVSIFSHDPEVKLDHFESYLCTLGNPVEIRKDYARIRVSKKVANELIAYNKKYANDLRQSKLDYNYHELATVVQVNKIRCSRIGDGYVAIYTGSGALVKDAVDTILNRIPVDHYVSYGYVLCTVDKDQIDSFISKIYGK